MNSPDVHDFAQHAESAAPYSPRSVGVPVSQVATITGTAPATVRRAGRTEQAAKRVLDFAGATILLLLLSPVLLLVALLVKLDSCGPAIFKQTRIGKDGHSFVFYKFRTMRDGCDESLHREHVTKLIRGELGDDDRGSDGSFKLEGDRRVTRLGHFLRASSIDELPQLFNVLKGEMSLVGPRPPLPYEVEEYLPRHMRRLEVLPGMTGLWQVEGRTEIGFEEMVDLDIKYVDEWSLATDLSILLRTIPACLCRRGAG